MAFTRREVFQRALEIVWRKKYLWFLGFFAGLVAHGGEPDLLFRPTSSLTTVRDYLTGLRDATQSGDWDRFVDSLRDFVASYPLNTIGIVLVGIILFVTILWLVIVSQSAIVTVVGRTFQKKLATLFDGLAAGAAAFWPVVTINVLAKLLTWSLWVIVFGIPAIVFLISGTTAWSLIASIGSLVVTLPVAIGISFLTKYAINGIVLQGLDPVSAIRHGWNLFKANWLMSMEIAVLVFLVNIAVVYVVAGVAVLTVQSITSWTELSILLVALGFVYAFVSVFSYSVWTIAYLKFLEGTPESAIGRWTSRLVSFVQPKKI